MALSRQEFVRGLIRLAQQYQMYGVSHTLVEDLLCSGAKTFGERMLIVCRNNPRGSPLYHGMVDMAQEVCILSLAYHDHHIAPHQVDELVGWVSDDAVFRLLRSEGRGKSVAAARTMFKNYVRTHARYLDCLQMGDLCNIVPRRVYELLMADH